eukprot:m.204034 g.204034  ORF g.204034 m.204034 type:complete len:305 (+) comp18869_c0_seq3:238-1152(+)
MSLLFGQKSKFSVFSQEEREELKVKIQALFESIDGSGPPRKGEQRSYRDGEIDRDEFRQLRWEQIEEILGEEVMRKRFIDVNNDGKLDMEDVWLQLDTNEDSKITPLEFLHECLGEAFVYPEDAKEAYDVYRDQEFHLPVPQLGNALRALGLNPSELEVMMIVNKYDTNADGYIDPDEWKSIVEDILHFPKDDRDRLRDAFTLLAKNQRDANGDPSISTEELVFVRYSTAILVLILLHSTAAHIHQPVRVTWCAAVHVYSSNRLDCRLQWSDEVFIGGGIYSGGCWGYMWWIMCRRKQHMYGRC